MSRVFSSRKRVVLNKSVETVNDKSLLETLSHESTPVLVDFYADWCGPCRMQSDVLDSFAASAGDSLKVVKIEIERYPDIGMSFNITALPTLILFVAGEPVTTLVGARDEKILRKDISKFVRL